MIPRIKRGVTRATLCYACSKNATGRKTLTGWTRPACDDHQVKGGK